jgi:hypothetical protein
MARVRVTAYFEPDTGDPNDPYGLTEEEFEDLMHRLLVAGLDDINIERST